MQPVSIVLDDNESYQQSGLKLCSGKLLVATVSNLVVTTVREWAILELK